MKRRTFMMRRSFLRAGLAGTIVGGATLAAPAVHAAEKFRWKMTTSFPPGLPFYQSGPGSAEWIVRWLGQATDGRLKIKLKSGGRPGGPGGGGGRGGRTRLRC